ncbi:MAG: hypothetical protein KatS3mg129_2881 [Leptospiraceae bacterium]|nr:MAG: hypothetical protein KatS3mg129_2881 [Leptospiraceae bacterium]
MSIKNQQQIKKNHLYKVEKIPFSLFIKFFKKWKNYSYINKLLEKIGINIKIHINQFAFRFYFYSSEFYKFNIPYKIKQFLFYLFQKYIFYEFTAYIHKKNVFCYCISSLFTFFNTLIFLFFLRYLKFFFFENQTNNKGILFFPFKDLSEILIIKNFHIDIICYKANLYHLDKIYKGYYVDLNFNKLILLKKKNILKFNAKNLKEISQLSFPSNNYNETDVRNYLFFLIGSKIYLYKIQLKFYANRIYQINNTSSFYIPLKEIQVIHFKTIPIEDFYLRNCNYKSE